MESMVRLVWLLLQQENLFFKYIEKLNHSQKYVDLELWQYMEVYQYKISSLNWKEGLKLLCALQEGWEMFLHYQTEKSLT